MDAHRTSRRWNRILETSGGLEAHIARQNGRLSSPHPPNRLGYVRKGHLVACLTGSPRPQPDMAYLSECEVVASCTCSTHIEKHVDGLKISGDEALWGADGDHWPDRYGRNDSYEQLQGAMRALGGYRSLLGADSLLRFSMYP